MKNAINKKVLVLATSFLDELITHPKDEGKAKHMLDELAGNSNDTLEIVYRCDRNPEEPLQAEEFENVAAVIADLEIYDQKLLAEIGKNNGGSLGLISRYGIGYSSVDLEAAAEFGVIVTNAPGCNALPTAEWTQSTIMDVAGRRILQYNTASVGNIKEGPSRLDVTGKTLGVIGTGTIGRYVIKLMKGYDVEILAYDIYPDHEWAKENNLRYTNIESICKDADIITLHASSSEMIIGQSEIDLMRPTTVLVNCARGILVYNREDYESVRNKKIKVNKNS